MGEISKSNFIPSVVARAILQTGRSISAPIPIPLPFPFPFPFPFPYPSPTLIPSLKSHHSRSMRASMSTILSLHEPTGTRVLQCDRVLGASAPKWHVFTFPILVRAYAPILIRGPRCCGVANLLAGAQHLQRPARGRSPTESSSADLGRCHRKAVGIFIECPLLRIPSGPPCIGDSYGSTLRWIWLGLLMLYNYLRTYQYTELAAPLATSSRK